MKRRLYIIISISIISCTILCFAINLKLPAIASFLIKRYTGITADIKAIDLFYRDKAIGMAIKSMALKGKIEGVIDRLDIIVGLDKGLIRKVYVTGFDISIKGTQRAGIKPPFPLAEVMEFKAGKITYDKEKIFIERVVFNNLPSEEGLTFEIKVSSDHLFKGLEASGKGLLKKGRPFEVKGGLKISSLNLNGLSDDMKGSADIRGSFGYTKKGRFSLDGGFYVDWFEIKDKAFKRPISTEKTEGKLYFFYEKDKGELKIRDVSYKGIPFSVDLKLIRDELETILLSIDFISLDEIEEHIDLRHFDPEAVKIWDYVRGGEVKIKTLMIDEHKPLHVEAELRNGKVAYKDNYFKDIGGTINIEGESIRLSDMKGGFGKSTFYNITGNIKLSGKRQFKVTGGYDIYLEDIPSFLEVKDISFKAGDTKGVLELNGTADGGFKFYGKGELKGGEVAWRDIAFKAKGLYRFDNEGIVFDPMTLKRGKAETVIRGRFNRRFFDLKVNGSIDATIARSFIKRPFYEMEGIADIDMHIKAEGETISLKAIVDIDDVGFEFPGIIKKRPGVKSRADLIFIEREGVISIERLDYNLGIINIGLKGNIKDRRQMDLDVALDIKGLDKVADLFFFNGRFPTKGDIDIKVRVKDLLWPIKALPYMEGYIDVDNVTVRLPGFAEPFEDVFITSAFNGDAVDTTIYNLKIGRTVLNWATIHTEGLEHPKFSIVIDMEGLDQKTFKRPGKFVLPAIGRDDFIARAEGDIDIKAAKVFFGLTSGEGLEAKGALKDGVFNLSEFNMKAFDGEVNLTGAIDFVQEQPEIRMNGRLRRIACGKFLKAAGVEDGLIEGQGGAFLMVAMHGREIDGLMRTINGEMGFYSRDGVIKRWNLLSKIFGLLNVYGWMGGKVEFLKEGLSYKRLGARFTVADGVFKTNDFIIDSPSMLIKGDGAIDLPKDEINGSISVAPLVTVDKIIDWVPIVKNILKQKKGGFLYVVYNVKGPLKDPEISLSLANTVEDKVIELFKNTIKLPLELFR